MMKLQTILVLVSVLSVLLLSALAIENSYSLIRVEFSDLLRIEFAR